MRAALLSIVAIGTFATSAATGYALSERSAGGVASSTTDGPDDPERQAHASAVEYVMQEFADKPMERMQFLAYEDAVHGAMVAVVRSDVDEAASTLLRAQDCAGILNKGHRTTITRDLILDLHHATLDNPHWKRILLRASELPSTRNGDPCRSEEELRAAPTVGRGTEPTMQILAGTNRPLRGRNVFHVKIDPETRRRARLDALRPTEPVRMRLD
jgi:hypothetical protein